MTGIFLPVGDSCGEILFRILFKPLFSFPRYNRRFPGRTFGYGIGSGSSSFAADIVGCYRVSGFAMIFPDQGLQDAFSLPDDFCDQPVPVIGPAYPVPGLDAEHLPHLFRDIDGIPGYKGLQRFSHTYRSYVPGIIKEKRSLQHRLHGGVSRCPA
jgi:hypothetical protein